MLHAHIARSGDTQSQSAMPFWIDLVNPTSDEMARVTAESGIKVPSRESLQEIETSSRLRADGQQLYVSMPLALQDEAAGFAPVPLGFVLSPQVLVTIRYSEVQAFGQVEACVGKGLYADSATVFAALIDAMVDDAPRARCAKISTRLATQGIICHAAARLCWACSESSVLS